MFERFVRDARYAALEANQRGGGPGLEQRRGRAPADLDRVRQQPAGAALSDVGLEPAGAARRAPARLRARARHRRDRRERRRPPRQLPPHEAELGHVRQAGARARGQGGQAPRRHARSAASTSSAACSPPSTAPCRASSRPRASTATSSPAGSRRRLRASRRSCDAMVRLTRGAARDPVPRPPNHGPAWSTSPPPSSSASPRR